MSYLGVICLTPYLLHAESVSRYTISQIVPHLVKLFLNPDELDGRPHILMLLSDLVTAVSKFTLTEVQALAEPDVLLLQFKDELLNVILVGLNTSSTRRPALNALQSMLTPQSLLTDDELTFIVHNINEILLTDLDDDDSRYQTKSSMFDGLFLTPVRSDAALDLLSTISTSKPRHIQEQTLPQLFGLLPDHAPSREANLERATYWRVLSALRKLCVNAELFETLVIRLTTKLDILCGPASDNGADIEPSAAYADSILKTLAQSLTTKVTMKHTDVPKYINSLVPRLYNMFICSSLVSVNDNVVVTDRRLVSVAAQIVTLVVQTLSHK